MNLFQGLPFARDLGVGLLQIRKWKVAVTSMNPLKKTTWMPRPRRITLLPRFWVDSSLAPARRPPP
jgi:hypothetical protein